MHLEIVEEEDKIWARELNFMEELLPDMFIDRRQSYKSMIYTKRVWNWLDQKEGKIKTTMLKIRGAALAWISGGRKWWQPVANG